MKPIILHHAFNPHYLVDGQVYNINDVKNYCADDDPQNILEWNIVNDINFRVCYKLLPIKQQQIHDQCVQMLDSYEEFPIDAKRTNRIVDIVHTTKNVFCVFIKKDDPELFVMEGRHRLVAYFEMGFKNIPVFFVE